MWTSAAKGINFSQTERDRIARKMPPTQIAEAQAMARDYAQKYHKSED